MKKLVFALQFLLFGTDRESNAHCTHLQIAQANPQTKICKKTAIFANTEMNIIWVYILHMKDMNIKIY